MPHRRRTCLAPIAACLPFVASCVPVSQDSRPALAADAVRLQYEVVAAAPHLPLSLTGVPNRGAAPAPVAAPFRLATNDRSEAGRATECLTAAIYYEARSEGEAGQRAVAQVVLNRVRHPAYPRTVCGVVYQHRPGRTCQFTFSCDGSTRRRREPAAWAEARRIAEEAMAGSVYAPVGLSTHYHTHAVSPGWGRRLARVAVVGAHIFYGGRDGPRPLRDFAVPPPTPRPAVQLAARADAEREPPRSARVRRQAAPAGPAGPAAPARRRPAPQPGFTFDEGFGPLSVAGLGGDALDGARAAPAAPVLAGSAIGR